MWTRSAKPDMPFVDAWRPSDKDLQIVAYACADLGNEMTNRRSVTGFVLQMEGCTHAHSTHKQRLITDGTCSSELAAVSECSTVIMWTHDLCKEIGLRGKKTIIFYDDNQAAVAVIEATTGDYKAKGIDLKYHKIRDYV